MSDRFHGYRLRAVKAHHGSPDEYIQRFAYEARIPTTEVRSAAATVAAALAGRLSPGQLAETLAQLPAPLRTLIGGADPHPVPREPARARPTPAHAEVTPESLLADLEVRVEALTEAVRALAAGFDEEPGAGVDEARRSRAARLAAEILMTSEKPTAQPKASAT